MAPSDNTDLSHTVNIGMSNGYPYLGYLAALLVVTLFIISVLDIISFVSAELKQQISLTLNPYLLNQDTIESSLLRLGTNTKDSNAYNIYTAQQVTSMMYFVFGFIIIYIIIHGLLVFFLKAFKVRFNKEKITTINSSQFTSIVPPTSGETPSVKIVPDEKSPNVGKAVFSIVIMFILAILYSSTFSNYFMKEVKPDIYELSNRIKEITGLVYDNISTDEKFLKLLVNDDINECYNIINKQGNRSEKIGSMIFSISVYDYYKNASDNRVFEKVKAMFTMTEIRRRTIQPFDYLYYNQKTFIPNLYLMVEPRMGENINKTDVRKDVKFRINSLNRKLVDMFQLATIRSSVRTYMVLCFFIAFVFVILLGVVYAEEILTKIKWIIDKIKIKNRNK